MNIAERIVLSPQEQSTLQQWARGAPIYEVLTRIGQNSEQICGKRGVGALCQTFGFVIAHPRKTAAHPDPIQGEVWTQPRVGFLEADTVAHCGCSLAGNFVWSLTYTDMPCTGTAVRAVWNKRNGCAGTDTRCGDAPAVSAVGI